MAGPMSLHVCAHLDMRAVGMNISFEVTANLEKHQWPFQLVLVQGAFIIPENSKC